MEMGEFGVGGEVVLYCLGAFLEAIFAQ